jgi:TonB family protein
MTTRRASQIIGIALLSVVPAAAQGPWTPARYRGGEIPALPALAVGGGEVVLELTVGDDGRVSEVKPLRTTAPFAERLAARAAEWQFAPAEEESTEPPARGGTPPRQTVSSKVLVVGVYRPPVLRGPTLGQPPRDVGAPSSEVAFPQSTSTPRFPPSARGAGQVVIEARVEADGAVRDVKVLQARPPFETAALTALGQWSFRPAQRRGVSVPSFVYIVFGFPEIVGIAK